MGTNEHDHIVRRLHSLGTRAVEPEVADRHASFLAAATPVAVASRRRPVFTAAMVAGLVLGGSGLAAALPGSLPEQAGSVAKSALVAVNLADDRDPSDEVRAAVASRKAASKASGAAGAKAGDTDGPGKVERFLEGCTAGTPPVAFVGNHGQYVKAHPDDPATTDVNERQVAAKSDCGKPISSIGDDGSADESADEADADAAEDEAGEPGDDKGRPADAGRPDSPGKSEESHPPATAAKEQGSEHRSTDNGNSENGNSENGNSDDAGDPADQAPEGVAPPAG